MLLVGCLPRNGKGRTLVGTARVSFTARVELGQTGVYSDWMSSV